MRNQGKKIAYSDNRETVRTSSRYLEESGAGTVLSLSLIGAISGLTLIMFAASATVIDQTRLNAIADNAAIAAADALRGLVAGYPCEVAKAMAPVTDCFIQGNDVLVTVQKGTLTARARAGEPG